MSRVLQELAIVKACQVAEALAKDDGPRLFERFSGILSIEDEQMIREDLVELGSIWLRSLAEQPGTQQHKEIFVSTFTATLEERFVAHLRDQFAQLRAGGGACGSRTSS